MRIKQTHRYLAIDLGEIMGKPNLVFPSLLICENQNIFMGIQLRSWMTIVIELTWAVAISREEPSEYCTPFGNNLRLQKDMHPVG